MIDINKLVNDLNLEFVTKKTNKFNTPIKSEMISRPGMELSGFWDYFDKERIVLLGSKEISYLNSLKASEAIIRFQSLIDFAPPCIIVSVNVVLPDSLINIANNSTVPILKSKFRTTPFYALLYGYLHERLSKRIDIKGTCLDIYGIGVLLIGEDNIGKSEAALELINRGHLLVSDDYVSVFEEYPSTIFATSNNNEISLNGIGKFDVMKHFGPKSYKETTKIELVINFCSATEQNIKKELNLTNYQIFNTLIPQIIFPIKKSQNMEALIESAVIYYKTSDIRPTTITKNKRD